MSLKTSFTTLVSASLIGVAVFHVSPSRAQSCQHSPSITLQQALAMEAKQDSYAAQFSGVVRSHNEFSGLKVVPKDLKIKTDRKLVDSLVVVASYVLPSKRAKTFGSEGGPLPIECSVTLPTGEVWYVQRSIDGYLMYFQPMN